MADDRVIAAAILSRRREKIVYRDEKFPLQDAFVMDPSQFLVAQCTRRAGKSNGLAIRFFRALAKYPGCFCPYVALTHQSAHNIMWPVLQEQDEKFKIGFKFTESDLTIRHPNGSKLQLFGADTKNFIRRLKGIKTPGCAIDEAQDFGNHLASLVDDVLTPAMADYEGSWLALTGTPGPVPRGYFFDITEQRRFGYSIHKWSLFDNPYLPNARAFVDGIKKTREWDDRNPTLLREYMNEWVLDLESLLIKYNVEKNDYLELPRGHWNYILGIDIGLRDADALAVLAWSESTPNIYLVEECITAGQDITALANQIGQFQRKYDIQKIVMDTGGLGAKIAEELTRRKHLPVQAADKKRKFENVAFLNDWLRLGQFKAKRESQFAQDSYQVQIDWEKTTPDRLVVKDSFHSDVCLVGNTLITTDKDPKPIEQLRRGDLVLTRQGYRKVLAQMRTGQMVNTVELTFSNGAKIVCTPSHRIFTQKRGWVPAIKLLHSDTFYIDTVCQKEIGQRVENGANKSEKPLFSTERNFTDILKPIRLTLETISGAIGVAVKSAFTDPLGSTTTASHPKANTFTTKTATRLTTPWKILSALKVENTLANIRTHITQMQKTWKSDGQSSPKLGFLRVPGIEALKEKLGIGPTSKISLTKRVVGPKSDVFNITVKDQHEYFAAGVLVKNCDAVLYAFRESPAFTFNAPKSRPKHGTREWAEQEEEEMFESALAKAEADQQQAQIDGEWGW